MGNEELVQRLRWLVSLNEPKRGGPYQGLAAAECVKAMRAAADALASEAAERGLAEAREVLATAREALEAIAQLSIAEVGERPESLNRIIEANQECASRAVAEMHGAGIRMADGSVSLPAILEKKPTKGTP